MNDPWTPYGGPPRGRDPVGAVPGVSGWILVVVGIAIVVMGVVQVPMAIEAAGHFGLKPSEADLVGLVLSFVPFVGGVVSVFGAVSSGQHGVIGAFFIYLWPYLVLMAVWAWELVPWLRARSQSASSDWETDGDDGASEGD